jgi:hypothetical protein
MVMQEQEVEVSFCDLCGTSVPAGDIGTQTAVLHQGKTIGSCCLGTLRGSAPAVAVAANSMPDAAGKQPSGIQPSGIQPSGGGDSSRILTVAIVMMIAFAGGVMFLDSRLSRVEDALIKASDAAATRQKADSDALQALSVKADGFAARGDVAAIGLKQTELSGTLATMGENATQRQKVLEQEVGGLRTQVNETMAKIVDYRPLFEDLRQRHTRAMAALEGMRSQVAAVPASATPVPGPGPAISEPVIDLPSELADQVRKLSAADPAVRFEAVDVLAESKNLKVLPYLLPLANDPDAFVRRLTVEGLREFRKPESVDALIAALRDEDENVCDTAWRSLRDLTGQKFKFEASASKEARGRSAQAWQDWWAKARATFGT